MRTPTCLGFVTSMTLSLAPAQSTWYVDDDGTGNGTGTVDDPYTSIQYAIEHPNTHHDDVLIVREGTYVEDVDLYGKRLSILGDEENRPKIVGVGAAATIAAPGDQPAGTRLADFVVVAASGGSQRCLAVDPGAEVALEHVRFEGGKDPYLPDSAGGQVVVEAGASLSMLLCELRAVEDIQRGGAVVVDGGSLTLVACDLEGAYGASQGRGGIIDLVAGDLLAVDSVFRNGFVDDIGDHGGAIAMVDSTAELEGCQFNDAFAFQAEAGAIWSLESSLVIRETMFSSCGTFQGPGGAILAQGGTLVLERTDFHGCDAYEGDGGAVYLDSFVQATFEECDFLDCFTDGGFWGDGHGGAVFGNALAEFRRCLFVENTAEGFPLVGEVGRGGAITEAALVEFCTFFGNRAGTGMDPGEGGALAAGVVSSSIVWGAHFPDAFAPGVVATYSDVQGGWPGEGNIDEDPLFSALEGGDFGLSDGSPCVDAGDSEAPYDEDGTPADQGASPYTWTGIGESYCFANANSSGLPAEMTVLGSPTLEKDFIRLRATSLPPYQFGFFLGADAPGFIPGVGGGMGNLCIGVPFVRLNTEPAGAVLFSGPEGRFELRARLVDLPPEFRPFSGETWHFQAWFRDVVGTDFTSNTSDAVALFFE